MSVAIPNGINTRRVYARIVFSDDVNRLRPAVSGVRRTAGHLILHSTSRYWAMAPKVDSPEPTMVAESMNANRPSQWNAVSRNYLPTSSRAHAAG